MYGQYKRINQHCGQFGKGLLWGGSPAYTQVSGSRGRVRVGGREKERQIVCVRVREIGKEREREIGREREREREMEGESEKESDREREAE